MDTAYASAPVARTASRIAGTSTGLPAEDLRPLHSIEMRVREAAGRARAFGNAIGTTADRVNASSGQMGEAQGVGGKAPEPPPGSIPAVGAAIGMLEEALDFAEREFRRIQEI